MSITNPIHTHIIYTVRSSNRFSKLTFSSQPNILINQIIGNLGQWTNYTNFNQAKIVEDLFRGKTIVRILVGSWTN